jgi:hypothetical protein
MAAVSNPKYIAICCKQSSSFTNKLESRSCLGVIKHATRPPSTTKGLCLKSALANSNCLSLYKSIHNYWQTAEGRTDGHDTDMCRGTSTEHEANQPSGLWLSRHTVLFSLIRDPRDTKHLLTQICVVLLSCCLVYPQQILDMGSRPPVTCVRLSGANLGTIWISGSRI